MIVTVWGLDPTYSHSVFVVFVASRHIQSLMSFMKKRNPFSKASSCLMRLLPEDCQGDRQAGFKKRGLMEKGLIWVFSTRGNHLGSF